MHACIHAQASRVLSSVRHQLVGCRASSLAALRRGLVDVIGEEELVAFTPEGLVCRMLGWEVPGGDALESLVFDETDWEDDQLRAAYQTWIGEWLPALPPEMRCAFLLLTFGAAVGAPLRKRTLVLASSADVADFLPEAGQLFLPMACSYDEFAARMASSIAITSIATTSHKPGEQAAGHLPLC